MTETPLGFAIFFFFFQSMSLSLSDQLFLPLSLYGFSLPLASLLFSSLFFFFFFFIFIFYFYFLFFKNMVLCSSVKCVLKARNQALSQPKISLPFHRPNPIPILQQIVETTQIQVVIKPGLRRQRQR
jgi:hypothetical protein